MENNKQDQQILSTLRNHPNKEPDLIFVEKLRKRLIAEKREDHRRRIGWPSIGVAFSVGLSVLIFTVISFSYLKEKQLTADKPKMEVKEKDTTFEKLITSSPAYEDIYDQTVEATGKKEQSKAIIYYLEGLRTGSDGLIKSVTMYPDDGARLYEIKQLYHNVNFSNLKLSSVKNETQDNRYRLDFIVQRGSLQQSKSIYLNISDPKAVKVEDPSILLKYDGKKEKEIAEMIKNLTSKIHVGMTKKQVKDAFGLNFEAAMNSDSEDGTVEEWRYLFLVEEGTYISENLSEVDVGNLSNQNIGIQLSIGWSSDGKALRLIAFYGQSGIVYAKGVNQNGKIEEQLSGQTL